MRNYLCNFCTTPCKKINPTDDKGWFCDNCETQYHIDLLAEKPYHYLLTRAIISYGYIDGVKNEKIPDKWYQVKSDFLTNTSIIYQVCHGVRYKVKDVGVHVLSDKWIRDNGISKPEGFSGGGEWALNHWIEYSLFQQNLPDKPPNIEFICLSCHNHCENRNPRFNLYWGCKLCNASYYLNEEPPHKLNRVQLSCQRDEHTWWCFEVNYRRNTTTLSYQEDKCETEVLKLDFIAPNVFAHNLKDWINNKLLFL